MNHKSQRAASVTLAELIADGLTEQTAAEWLAHRKRKKATLTARAWSDVMAEAKKAGWTVESAVCKALGRGWTGLEAAWLAKEQPPGQRRTAYDVGDVAAKASLLLAQRGHAIHPPELLERVDASQ